MYSTLLKAKLHMARVTQCELEYEGSLTIDPELMEEVKILPYEKILVANVENGERFETYAIPGERGERMICLNGATAHKGTVGDRIIVFTFTQLPTEEARQHKPLVIILDANNQIVRNG